MPEIVTKYPQVVMQILKDSNAKCGQGHTPTYLKNCPKEQFCVLPTGEFCVYDFTNTSSMTQINSSEWLESVSGVPGLFSISNLIILLIVFGFGMWVGMKTMKL